MKANARLLAVMAVAMMLALCTSNVFAEDSDDSGYAEGAHKGHKEGKGDKEGFLKDLNLTPQQKDQMKADREQNAGKMKELRETTRAKRTELKAEFDKPTVDTARVNAIATELKTLEGQKVDMMVARLLSLKKILTPEQFQKMQEKMEKKKEEWSKKAGKHDDR